MSTNIRFHQSLMSVLKSSTTSYSTMPLISCCPYHARKSTKSCEATTGSHKKTIAISTRVRLYPSEICRNMCSSTSSHPVSHLYPVSRHRETRPHTCHDNQTDSDIIETSSDF